MSYENRKLFRFVMPTVGFMGACLAVFGLPIVGFGIAVMAYLALTLGSLVIGVDDEPRHNEFVYRPQRSRHVTRGRILTPHEKWHAGR